MGLWSLLGRPLPLPRDAPQSPLQAEMLGRMGFHREHAKLSLDGEAG